MSAVFESVNQFGPLIPKIASPLLIRPISGLNIQLHTIDIATIGVIHGANKKPCISSLPRLILSMSIAIKKPKISVGTTVPRPNNKVFLSACQKASLLSMSL